MELLILELNFTLKFVVHNAFKHMNQIIHNQFSLLQYRTNQLNKINIHHCKTKHNTNMKKRVTSEFKTSGAAWTTVDNWRGFAFVILNVLPETKHRDWSFSFEDNNGEEFEEREREGMNVAEREETAIETNSLKRKKERLCCQ